MNLSSGWGSFAEGLGGPGFYGVTKAALNALTVRLAEELPAPAIKVNAMCPGWVRTRMGGPGASRTPESAADTAVWLATLPGDGPSGGFFRGSVQGHPLALGELRRGIPGTGRPAFLVRRRLSGTGFARPNDYYFPCYPSNSGWHGTPGDPKA